MSILSETTVEFGGKFYKISKVSYAGTVATTFLVDQSAVNAVSVEPASGAPTASLGSADANFEKTVTLPLGSAAATVTVITVHNGTPSSAKPSARA